MYAFINLVRAIASCIIVNSHLTPIYTYDFIAKGGAFGNSLFFLASGFCLANCKGSFGSWYSKRLLRLYVPLFLVSALYIYPGETLFTDIIFSYIFPVNYWFLCSLIILYPFYYFVVKYPFKNRKYIYSILLTILYFTVYWILNTSSYIVESISFYGIRFSYIFSFFLMLLGAFFKKHYDIIKNKFHQKHFYFLFACFCSFILYFGFIFAMHKYNLYALQFIETFLCITTSSTLFIFFLLLEDFWRKSKDSKLLKFLNFLGNHTLEIYLLQAPIIHSIAKLQLSSVCEFAIAVSLILLCANILKFVTGKIIKFLLSQPRLS